MFKYLALILILFVSTAHASNIIVNREGAVYLDVSLTSYHFDRSPEYKGVSFRHNEDNFGLGVSYQLNEDIELKLGYFENSHYKTSVYALVNKTLWNLNSSNSHWDVRAGLAAGLVSGYEGTKGENELSFGVAQPMILPNVVIGYKRVQSLIGLVPSVIMLQIQMRVN